MLKRLLFILLVILLIVPCMFIYTLMPPIRWAIKGGTFIESLNVTLDVIEKILIKTRGY